VESLIAGYRRFRQTTWPVQRERAQILAQQGQNPVAAVIACVDSRLDPEAIFDASPGQILVMRNVANLVPPYEPDSAFHGTSAGIEFAVRGLEVGHIVVMGHARCGGVAALLRGGSDQLTDFILPWMNIAARAKARALACEAVDSEAAQTICEHETVLVSLENLQKFPWVAERVAAGTLKLHGFYYGIASGVLEVLGEDGKFRPVE